MKNVLFISPHADDETLGCGGIMHKFSKEKKKVFWLNITKLDNVVDNLKREKVIRNVAKNFKLYSFQQLNFKTTDLGPNNLSKIIVNIKDFLNLNKIDTLFIPFIGDVHSDHYYVARASISAAKSFRCKYIKRIYYYETLSETNFNFGMNKKFNPNCYFDISKFIEKKINTLNLYKSEIGKHPFPRNKMTVKSLAIIRGSESGFKFAEAFELIFSKS